MLISWLISISGAYAKILKREKVLILSDLILFKVFFPSEHPVTVIFSKGMDLLLNFYFFFHTDMKGSV